MENEAYLDHLHDFIVEAKAATYVGGGNSVATPRGSTDLVYSTGEFTYADSYFGAQDFIGQEVVYYKDEPIWVMNYYGKILMPKKITGEEAGAIIKESLSKMYAQGRFLGNFEHNAGEFQYYDTNIGGVSSFTGREWITRNNEVVYELVYHGGVVK